MESVKLIECPRDAWQGLRRFIPTERKVEYLRGLISAGIQHIDAVSFVSPKAVPQMADSEQVLAQLRPSDGVEVIGIVVNEKGAERAIATRSVTTLGYPCSVSETFLRRNQNQSLSENQATLSAVNAMAREAGLNVVAYISMAFGNPYGDSWNEAMVADMAASIAYPGIRAISLADTVGTATPELIHKMFGAVLRNDLPCEVGIHMHSTRAAAAGKILAAYDAGCRRFDSALGGLGGCPFAQDDLVGNIPTEEVVNALSQRGVTLPVKETIPRLLEMNDAISREFGAR